MWPDDEGSILTLQEMFGYLLLPDTSQQKIFFVVGPPRSGKGTITRVLSRLIGEGNVASPTLSDLTSRFGLAPLIDRSVAIVADARLGSRDLHVVVERLLSISGEDNQTIDVKFKDAWNGRLTLRFLILSNELPAFQDASGALVKRMIVLKMKRSFEGQEDPHLIGTLEQELSGILNWTVEGWRRLSGRGHFVQPSSSAEVVSQLADLASPVQAFVTECCEVSPSHQIACSDLFPSWRAWCQRNGYEGPGTIQNFGRELRAAVPTIDTFQPRAGGNTRVRFFTGIALKPNVERGGTRSIQLCEEMKAKKAE